MQWGLKNNAYPNIDISACDAWDIATGQNVKIAIVDLGVQLNHIDLAGNIYPLSYDTKTHSSPSRLYNDRYNNNSHGTHCAGIAAAKANNGILISGVAPNAKIMSVSYDFLYGNSQQLANGIMWAWINGADVISCSFGGPPNDAIEDAINYATNFGRDGLGCVVVAASGNEAQSLVSFPAKLSNVISAGAINQDGTLASFSNHGTQLNVCAPGVNIYSTVTYNNAQNMSGTSMACPHVSGLAALILEIGKNFRYNDVKDVIERTTKKIGSIPYPFTMENGTWNIQYGYGLIDAYAACQYAQTYCPVYHFSNQTISLHKTDHTRSKNGADSRRERV